VEELEILKRSSLLSMLLLVTILFVVARTYQLWRNGPWELPQPSKVKEFALSEELKKEPQQTQLASTKNIVENNLFDPERGGGMVQAEASSVAAQRIRRMILVGTVILGTSRYAIFQDPASSGPSAATAQSSQIHLKLGDTVDSFKLSEINEKRVVFTSGASKLEVLLDFFRSSEDVKTPASAPSRPGSPVAPNVPPTGRPLAPRVPR